MAIKTKAVAKRISMETRRGESSWGLSGLEGG